MAVFRHPNGTYYAIFSHLTGWDPNPLVLLRAAGSSLADPQWENMGNPTHEPKSYNLQPTSVLRLSDARGRPYFVLLGDNWKHAGPRGLRDAGYVWLPMIFSRSSVRLQRLGNWSVARPFASPPHRDHGEAPCGSGDATQAVRRMGKSLWRRTLGTQAKIARCGAAPGYGVCVV